MRTYFSKAKGFHSFLTIIFLSSLMLFTVFSCKNKPTILEPVTHGISENAWDIDPPGEVVREVIAEEVLHTSKYTYVLAKEGDNTSWIAVPRMEAEVGETYYFKGGTKMRNFESKEYNRIFPELLLVSGLSSSPDLSFQNGMNVSPVANLQVDPQDISPLEDGVSLKDLFADPGKYTGKTIKVKGKCVKVNRQIMGRNWIHLQDGSNDDSGNALDLTVTSDVDVAVGAVVVLEGVIALNKDFGAGYRYDVIMEDAVIK